MCSESSVSSVSSKISVSSVNSVSNLSRVSSVRSLQHNVTSIPDGISEWCNLAQPLKLMGNDVVQRVKFMNTYYTCIHMTKWLHLSDRRCPFILNQFPNIKSQENYFPSHDFFIALCSKGWHFDFDICFYNFCEKKPLYGKIASKVWKIYFQNISPHFLDAALLSNSSLFCLNVIPPIPLGA